MKSKTYTQSKRPLDKNQSSTFCQSGVKQTHFQNLKEKRKWFFLSQGHFKGMTHHKCPKLSVRESQQKYKDLYGNPNKRPDKIILQKNYQLKSLTFLPLWVASFLSGFFFSDLMRIEPLSFPWLSTVIVK